ncbi:hypothetical protein BE08_04020 [Sorangium cellulosum]|uniref:Uncharacterized protein n=1 Tax=Sorangium cellulosum TaxID=56 RepID=A0A150P7P0_SORCE|nr:hypothetical protein BE08_04020 [Sorangium cellulosum]
MIQTGPDPWGAEVGYYALRWAIAGLAELPPDGGNASNWSGATPEARRGLLEIFGKGDRGSDVRRHAWNKPSAGGLSPDDRRFIAAEALRWALSRAQQAAFPHRVLSRRPSRTASCSRSTTCTPSTARAGTPSPT